jgi:hypothetical protein
VVARMIIGEAQSFGPVLRDVQVSGGPLGLSTTGLRRLDWRMFLFVRSCQVREVRCTCGSLKAGLAADAGSEMHEW